MSTGLRSFATIEGRPGDVDQVAHQAQKAEVEFYFHPSSIPGSIDRMGSFGPSPATIANLFEAAAFGQVPVA